MPPTPDSAPPWTQGEKYEHPAWQRAFRTADAHTDRLGHVGWVLLTGVGIECREPDCGWARAEHVIESEVANRRNIVKKAGTWR